jgi:hypothetical protein
MQSSLYDENIKRNNEPIYDKKHLFFTFWIMSEVWYYNVRSMIEEPGSSVERSQHFSQIAAVIADSRMSH